MDGERESRAAMVASGYRLAGSGMAWRLEDRDAPARASGRSPGRGRRRGYSFLHSPGRDLARPVGDCPSVFGMTLLDCESRNLSVPSIHSRLVASSIIKDKNRVCQLSMLAMKAAMAELLATTQRRNNISYKRRLSKAMVGTPFLKPGKIMSRDSDNVISYANEDGDVQCMIFPNTLPQHGAIPSHIPSRELQLLGDVNIKTVLNRLQSSFVVRYHVSTIPAVAYRCERRWRSSIAWLRRLKDEEHRLRVARYDAAMVNMAYTRAAFEKINRVVVAHIEARKVRRAREARDEMRRRYGTPRDMLLWDRLHPTSLGEAVRLDTAARTIQRTLLLHQARRCATCRPGTGQLEPLPLPLPPRFQRKDVAVDIHRLDAGEASGIGLTPQAGAESAVHFQESFDSEYIESCGSE